MYSGIIELTLENEDLAKLYEGTYKNERLLLNEYIIVRDVNSNQVDEGKWDGEKFVKIKPKNICNNLFGTFSPRNQEQRFAFDLMQDSKIVCKILLGNFGTGKTMISLVHALNFISGRSPCFDRLIYLRNNVGVKNVDDIGALPGDLIYKIKPYIMPLSDILGEESSLDALIFNGKIVPTHIGFLRGRSFKNSVIFCSESQNLTLEHLALIVSRVGENSMLIIEADLHQRDRTVFEKSNGLEIMVDKLKGDPEFGVCTLVKNERSRFASLAEKLLE